MGRVVDGGLQVAIIAVSFSTGNEQRGQAFDVMSIVVVCIALLNATGKAINQLKRVVIVRKIDIADDLIDNAGFRYVSRTVASWALRGTSTTGT